jgi:hypothetical protein
MRLPWSKTEKESASSSPPTTEDEANPTNTEKTAVTEEHEEHRAEADASDATRTASDTESVEDESKYPKGFPLIALTLGLCGTTFLIALDNTIIATGMSIATYNYGSQADPNQLSPRSPR